MKISDFKLTKGNRTRICAKITFEDCDQPEKEIFIETSNEFGSSINLNPSAFLVGSIIPALYFKERRVAVDGRISPFLIEGLETVMALMENWTKGEFKPLVIESSRAVSLFEQLPGNRAGMVFSGGVDSIAALRLNRLRYHKNHPGYIRDCFFIHGFDIGGVVERGMKYHVFERAFNAMEKITHDAEAELIPVYTNIRHLCDERDLWLNRFFGAVLASVAHAFSSRINLFYIASSYDVNNLVPCGSHPLLDPEYSSFDVRIRHRDLSWSRIDKIRLISDWDNGLKHLRVCLANVKDHLNCGKCEKCIRTMTALLAVDALHKSDAFIENDVTPEMFEPFKINIRHREPFYCELIPLLKEKGRDDLVDTIKEKFVE
ncbi:MAG: hypothetical protein U9N77_03570 [Thermodesulfobacteriota bacterium]|nr:hypothetical protein [Thermodesulfobacteriota bacterium]